MSLLPLIGALFVLIGLVGVRFAPQIVDTQHNRGMTPVDVDEITDSDRVQVTKGVSVVCTIVGFALIVYGVL